MAAIPPAGSLRTIDDAIRELLETYHDINPSEVEELLEEPSALEFMHYVARNRPFVVRKGAESWPAVQKWSAQYLIDTVGENDVNVAITPLGNADSVVQDSDGSYYFVKPYERNETFRNLITYIQKQEQSPASKETPVKYGQTQNDNLRQEYSPLFSDVPATGPPFARIALRQNPDAINFWLGNSRSVTSMHKDNYENIYAQIRGQKHFVLLPPIAAPAVNEVGIRAATYSLVKGRGGSSAGKEGDEGEDKGQQEEKGKDEETWEEEVKMDDLIAQTDESGDLVRWALWDPDVPEERATAYSKIVKPLRVTLEEGDLLYLPALWYHKVAQSCGKEGFCCAVNYWYDMEFSGSFWATNSFVRDVAKVEAVNAINPPGFQTNLYQ